MLERVSGGNRPRRKDEAHGLQRALEGIQHEPHALLLHPAGASGKPSRWSTANHHTHGGPTSEKTRPVASFGKKEVDFSGISSPARQTARTSAIVGGFSRK